VGPCDLAEVCNGSDVTCPPDVLQPAGTFCGPAGSACGSPERCDGSTGLCPPSLVPPSCPCSSPAPISAQTAKLTIRNLNVVGRSKLSLKGVLSGLPPTPPIDPVSKGLRLLIEGANDTGSTFDVTIPPGAYSPTTGIGWRENITATHFEYRNPAGVQGITKVRLHLVHGLVKFSALGKNTGFNGGYPVDPSQLPLSALVVFDTPDGSNGQCAIATFPGPAPNPSCTATPAVIRCK
jgi:hypothetical protein